MAIVFKIQKYESGLALGKLTWTEKNLTTMAISGPYGRKELPAGLYHVFRNELLDKSNQESYCDSLRNCWMQVIRPQFSTSRTELGIHPDGNKQGTLGCIGLFESDTSKWKDAFASIEIDKYTILEVFI